MHGIQPQTVEMIFSQPVERIINEEIPDNPVFRAVEVDAVAPWRAVTIGKKLWRVGPKIISFRAKMVVNNIQQNYHSSLVGSFNQLVEVIGPTVSAIRTD